MTLLSTAKEANFGECNDLPHPKPH